MKFWWILFVIFWASMGMIGWFKFLHWSYQLVCIIDKKKCWFRHRWETHQGTIGVSYGVGVPLHDVVIAFKVCKRCAASKLVHLLQ